MWATDGVCWRCKSSGCYEIKSNNWCSESLPYERYITGWH
jgi:hypothetical protein